MEGTPVSLIATDNTPSSSRLDDNPQPLRRSYPAIVHAAVISTFLLPIAIIPYLLAKRHIVSLQRRTQILQNEIRRLRSDLNVATSNQRSTGSELRILQTHIHKILKEVDGLRNQANRQESDRITTNQEIQKDLKKLLNDIQHSRSQMNSLYPLGRSLADIAAFMQEIEIRLGLESSDQSKDQRGVERLRSLALRLHLQTRSRQPKKHKDAEESVSESP